MRKTAIFVENLGKQYSIGTSRNGTFSFQHTLLEAIKEPLKRIVRGKGGGTSANFEPFWALKDVSFKVKCGEVVGVIGRNGSGKSTLLKILSRIVEPTTGKAIVNGRVGSLLEIGMGFHPELTGRENIYLSGAVLGMKRNEIDNRFDAIVDFSGVEAFLDTPVKRYSSGMYVRLAFAVAAQMEPEILIIDEVLAVGDQSFQKKCIQRMELLAQEGRTILFVSHSMESVRRLCDTAILLENGQLTKHGPSDDVVDTYLNLVDDDVEVGDMAENPGDIGRIIARLTNDPAFRLNNLAILQDGQATMQVSSARPINLRIDYEVLEECPGLYVFFRLYSHSGSLVFESLHNGSEADFPIVTPGEYISVAEIPPNFLSPKPYELWVGAAIHNVRSCLPHMIRLPLVVHQAGSAHRAYPNRRVKGEIEPLISWKTELQEVEIVCESEEVESDSPFPVTYWDTFNQAPGNNTVKVRCVSIHNKDGSIVGTFDNYEAFDVKIEYWSMKIVQAPDVILLVQNESNECVVQSSNNTGNSKPHCMLPIGLNKTTCSIDNNPFVPGRLHFTVIISTGPGENPIRLENVVSIDIIGTRNSPINNLIECTPSRIQPVLPWRTVILNETPVPERVWEDLPSAPGNAHFQLYAVRILDEHGVARGDIPASKGFSVELEYFNWSSDIDLLTAIVFHYPNGESSILHVNDKEHEWGGFPRPCSRHKLICHIPIGVPCTGRVSLSVIMWCDQMQLPLVVNEANGVMNSPVGLLFQKKYGKIYKLLPAIHFSLSKRSESDLILGGFQVRYL